nr:hypothetical protein KPHV_39270 [Kitasatospora purpeofusca]
MDSFPDQGDGRALFPVQRHFTPPGTEDIPAKMRTAVRGTEFRAADGLRRRARPGGNGPPADHPPATAGMIEMLAPSLISVSRPSANRTSSSFT